MTGPVRTAPHRVLLAWLAGALLLVGLPGPAASVAAAGSTTSAPSTSAPAEARTRADRPAAPRVAPSWTQRVAQRGARTELVRFDAARHELARSPRLDPPHAAADAPAGGFAAALAPGPRVVSGGTDAPGAVAPAEVRGRAPPAAGSARIAGIHSA